MRKILLGALAALALAGPLATTASAQDYYGRNSYYRDRDRDDRDRDDRSAWSGNRDDDWRYNRYHQRRHDNDRSWRRDRYRNRDWDRDRDRDRDRNRRDRDDY